MIQDPEISQMEVGRLVEDWLKIDEDHYLDGPVTPRVAVIDLNPNTEALEPGAVFIPPEGRRTLGSYKVDRKRIYSAHFIQVSVFATVLRTMYMYEEQDTLGRRVAWGFDAPQLLVVPRAGWWANAYYERRSHSLQFFSFRAGGKLIHTSLSRDIVAHETAHALIDGIDPDLYDALDPQSLALHEGVADLTAVLIAFRSGKLRRAVLDQDRRFDREVDKLQLDRRGVRAGASTRAARPAGCATCSTRTSSTPMATRPTSPRSTSSARSSPACCTASWSTSTSITSGAWPSASGSRRSRSPVVPCSAPRSSSSG